MANSLQYRTTSLSEVLADRLEKPSLDDRTYRVVKLPNKLEALLIHDPDTDKASAAMDVNAGSFSDEPALPGMAHAVEHLLFMGTKKYPKENEYSQFLSNHSGNSNAFTASTSTNYFFEVSAKPDDKSTNGIPATTNGEVSVSPLHGALDRFAQFFIEPLFLEETLDRELRAVDSENKKNLQSDMWRLHQLEKSLSNPKHPYCHFSTGNLKTLRDDPIARGVRIRDEFMRFHKEQYSANRMKLVVLGRESLNQLQSWVEKMFSDVVNKDLPQNRWDGIPPLTSAELHTQVFAKPVMNTRSLEITFPYQDEEEMYDTNPGRYISHLLGHEGPGSVLAYIKEKGWANDLSASSNTLCPGSGIFTVTVGLTPDGLKQYKEVAKSIFQYISILHESKPEAWIFDEIGRMAEVNFKFKQKSPASGTTSRLSQTMQNPLPRERLLSGNGMLRRFDADAIQQAVNSLNAESFRMMIVSQEDLPGSVQKEHWYGTEYSVERIPQEFLAEIRKAAGSKGNGRPKELYLPTRNEFVPERLEVERKTVNEPSKAPKLVRHDENVRTWFKKDDQFWVPKANIEIMLRTPVVHSTPRNMVMSYLVESLVNDSLEEYGYDADIAGLFYDISMHASGMDISVSGYNDKMSILLEKVVTAFRDLKVRDDRFEIRKEWLTRNYKNFGYISPYEQIGQHARWLANERGWNLDQFLAEIDSITADDIRRFHPLILQQVHLETLVHGNLCREDALKLTNLVESLIKPKPLPTSLWPIRRSVTMPPGSDYVYSLPLKDPSNINHCIEYMLQVCEVKDRETCARVNLFAQMTQEPAFDQLRTKEQLGYVVFSGSSAQIQIAVYHVLIQSERSPDYLEGRIDSFLTGFGKDLAAMSQDDFEAHKKSLINERLEKIKNLNQEADRFWNHITDEVYRFEQRDEDVALIKLLTKDDMIAFFETCINPASTKRAKLSVHMIAQSSAADQPTEVNGESPDTIKAEKKKAIKIEDVRAWKASMGLSSGASPARPLSSFEDREAKL